MIRPPPPPAWQMWLVATFCLALGVSWWVLFWPNFRRAVLTGKWHARGAIYDRRKNPGMYWLGVLSVTGIAALLVAISLGMFATLIFEGWPTSWEPNAPRVRW